MWDKLVQNSAPRSLDHLLTPDSNWRLDEWSMKTGLATLRFVQFNGDEVRIIEFYPVYLSVSDDFAEDYAGIWADGKDDKLSEQDAMKGIQEKIASNFPSAAKDYNDLRAHYLSAMEWRIRFISQGEPKLTVSPQ